MTGAVYADDASNTIFGGEVVFAHNTADLGGTSVTGLYYLVFLR